MVNGKCRICLSRIFERRRFELLESMNLSVSSKAFEKINSSILITGTARSGTTILGKVVHSMKDVEYAYEPPMLFSLIASVDSIPVNQWKLLFETYLYEDFFLETVAGRRINTNRADDSSIYNVKTEAEIQRRLKVSIRKLQLERLIDKNVLVFKMPDIPPFLPAVQRIYTGMKVVFMHREPIGVLNSLIDKGWFADNNEKKNLIWPFKVINGYHVPFWVEKKFEQKWINLSEVDRCAYYYLRVTESRHDLKKCHVINYNDLLAHPVETVKQLSKHLQLEFGSKTEDIIQSIQPTQKQRDSKILKKVSKTFDKIYNYFS